MLSRLLSVAPVTPVPSMAAPWPGASAPSTSVASVAPTQLMTPLPTAEPLLEGAVIPPVPGAARGKTVYLTFDDGPSEWTPRIRKVLDNEGVKATFFTIGEQVEETPGRVAALAADGMSVQAHSWSHRRYTRLSDAQLTHDLERTNAAIADATGIDPVCVRPPFGLRSDEVDQAIWRQDLSIVMWNVDSEDWRRQGKKQIVRTVMSEVSNGSVILFHDGGGGPEADDRGVEGRDSSAQRSGLLLRGPLPGPVAERQHDLCALPCATGCARIQHS